MTDEQLARQITKHLAEALIQSDQLVGRVHGQLGAMAGAIRLGNVAIASAARRMGRLLELMPGDMEEVDGHGRVGEVRGTDQVDRQACR